MRGYWIGSIKCMIYITSHFVIIYTWQSAWSFYQTPHHCCTWILDTAGKMNSSNSCSCMPWHWSVSVHLIYSSKLEYVLHCGLGPAAAYSQVRVSISALMSDPDLYPWVFQSWNAIPRFVWVSATRWLKAASQKFMGSWVLVHKYLKVLRILSRNILDWLTSYCIYEYM